MFSTSVRFRIISRHSGAYLFLKNCNILDVSFQHLYSISSPPVWNTSKSNNALISEYKSRRISKTRLLIGFRIPQGGCLQNSSLKQSITSFSKYCQPSPTWAGTSSSGITLIPRIRAYSTISLILNRV